jgi:lysophospholipase L1-like esterase
MKSRFVLFYTCVMWTVGCFAASADEPAPAGAKAPRPTDPALIDVPDVAGLPRVLLIGDSISMGYTVPVRNRLAGRANVHHPAENCGETARGLKNLDRWLETGHWDVIHFNFGLHDLKYLDAQGKYVPPEQGKQVASLVQYEANLRRLVAQLKRTGATLIFATTTPVPEGTLGRVGHDEIKYNEVARRLMAELGVAIDDLAEIVAPHQAEWQRPKNVHFTNAGYDALADAVVASINPALEHRGADR